jgi:hypothetical protein
VPFDGTDDNSLTLSKSLAIVRVLSKAFSGAFCYDHHEHQRRRSAPVRGRCNSARSHTPECSKPLLPSHSAAPEDGRAAPVFTDRYPESLFPF